MRGANDRLIEALEAHGLHSWVDCVGVVDIEAMAATPPALRRRGSNVSAHHYRTVLLPPRYAAPTTPAYT
jgi:hypothetical protein